MKINLSKLCLRLSSVFAVLAIFSTFLFSVSAEKIDYNDYISNISVDGDNDIVTVSLPLSPRYTVWEDGVIVLRRDSPSFSMPFYYDRSYNIRIIPIRYDSIDLKDIPNGTLITFNVDVSNTAGPYSTPRYDAYVEYLDTDGTTISSQRASLGNNPIEAVPSTFTLAIPNNADSFSFRCIWSEFKPYGDNSLGYDDISFNVTSYTLTMKISSLLRLQQATGRTNSILKEVELQLAEQGKTLDDIRDQNDVIIDQNDQIINGTVTPESPDGGDSFDDLGDAEAGLRDDAQSGLDTGIEITQNALEIILQYATAFACAGWIFECFSTLPIFTALLFVSIALGIFGLVVNLANDVGRAHRHSKSGRNGKKGG